MTQEFEQDSSVIRFGHLARPHQETKWTNLEMIPVVPIELSFEDVCAVLKEQGCWAKEWTTATRGLRRIHIGRYSQEAGATIWGSTKEGRETLWVMQDEVTSFSDICSGSPNEQIDSHRVVSVHTIEALTGVGRSLC